MQILNISQTYDLLLTQQDRRKDAKSPQSFSLSVFTGCLKRICETVTGGSVLSCGAQPPASVTNSFPVVFGVKFYCYRHPDRVKYGGSTLPKKYE